MIDEATHQRKLAYQRQYYRDHREHVLAKVRECQLKRVEREKKKLWNHGE